MRARWLCCALLGAGCATAEPSVHLLTLEAQEGATSTLSLLVQGVGPVYDLDRAQWENPSWQLELTGARGVLRAPTQSDPSAPWRALASSLSPGLYRAALVGAQGQRFAVPESLLVTPAPLVASFSPTGAQPQQGDVVPVTINLVNSSVCGAEDLTFALRFERLYERVRVPLRPDALGVNRVTARNVRSFTAAVTLGDALLPDRAEVYLEGTGRWTGPAGCELSPVTLDGNEGLWTILPAPTRGLEEDTLDVDPETLPGGGTTQLRVTLSNHITTEDVYIDSVTVVSVPQGVTVSWLPSLRLLQANSQTVWLLPVTVPPPLESSITYELRVRIRAHGATSNTQYGVANEGLTVNLTVTAMP